MSCTSFRPDGSPATFTVVSERPLEITGQFTATPQKFVHVGLDVGALDILEPFTSRPILSLSTCTVMNLAVYRTSVSPMLAMV